jgi:hypothetical protein
MWTPTKYSPACRVNSGCIERARCELLKRALIFPCIVFGTPGDRGRNAYCLRARNGRLYNSINWSA